MKKTIGVLLVLLGVAAVAACDDDDNASPAADTPDASNGGKDASNTGKTDAGSSQDAAGSDDSATDGGGTCNELTNGATDVSPTSDPGALPDAKGGTIADGTYFLTEVRTYGGGMLDGTFRRTVVISGGATLLQLVANDSAEPEFHSTSTIVTKGTAVTLTDTCTTEKTPTPIPYGAYTASDTTIQLFSSALNFAVTFTKQ